MGIMICETHGRVHPVEACSHIAEKISDGKPLRGHKFSLLTDFHVCDQCFETLGFEKFANIANPAPKKVAEVHDDLLAACAAASEAIGGGDFLCPKCIAELSA